MTKTDDQTLRAVTQRVVDTFTAQGALFTALDVSNAVKGTLPDVRHRQVSPLVRDLFDRKGMGDYARSTIEVLAEGRTPTEAFLYHLPEHSPALYDDSMRNQLAIPPVSTSTDKNDDKNVTAHTVEAPTRVGRDGRARVARQLLMNAGVVGDLVRAEVDHEGKRIVLTEAPEDASEGDGDGDESVLEYEHPSLLHVPRRLVGVFTPGAKLVARVLPHQVEIVEHVGAH